MRGDMGSHDEIDDNLIAAYAEGRLTGARRARMEAHLATDPEARALVAALVIDREADDGYRPEEASPTPPAAPREEAAWSRWLPFAAAATVLLAVGAAVLTRPADTTALDTTARMVAAAEDLGARRPDLFRGFRPVDVAALPRRAPTELRGGILVTAPRERTILGRPGERRRARARSRRPRRRRRRRRERARARRPARRTAARPRGPRARSCRRVA